MQIAFRTVTDNTNGDLISVYKVNTLVYDPADDVISEISHIKRIPSSGEIIVLYKKSISSNIGSRSACHPSKVAPNNVAPEQTQPE